MLPRRGLSPLLALFAAMLFMAGTPSGASAWTRSMVKTADATVEVGDDASMRVRLALDVEVQAGWLRAMVIAELGEDVELDRSHPPYFRSDEGEVYRPEVEVTPEGAIQLVFDRREAPRQGDYRVFIRYEVPGDVERLADSDRVRLSWTLPAWETGLQDVKVDVRAPRESTLPDNRELGPGVNVDVTAQRRVTQIEWRRIHLPRHTPWTLEFDVPANAVALPPVAPEPATPSAFTPLDPAEPPPFPWVFAAIALAILLKRALIQFCDSEQALLVRIPWPAAWIALIAPLSLGAWLGGSAVLWVLPALTLGLQRPARSDLAPLRDDWQPAGAPDRRALDLLLSDFLDGTTLIGLVVFGASATAVVGLGEPIGALLLIPVFFVGTRLHTRPTDAEAARRLRAFVETLELPADAPPMAFCWERAGEAYRCRILLPTERAGLLSVAFVVATTKVGFCARRDVVLLVETRAQSDAEDLVRRRVGATPDARGPHGRIGRRLEWQHESMGLIRALTFETQSATVHRSSTGSWLLRAITDEAA